MATKSTKSTKQKINPAYLQPHKIIRLAEKAFKGSDAELHGLTKALIAEITRDLPTVREMLSVQAHIRRFSGWYERVMESAVSQVGFSLLHHTLAVCANSDNLLTGGEDSKLDFTDTILLDHNSHTESFSKIYCGSIYTAIHHDLHETVTGFGDVSGMVKSLCPFIIFLEKAYDCAIEASSGMPLEQLSESGRYVASSVASISDAIALQNELSIMSHASEDTDGEMMASLEASYRKASDSASILSIRFKDADILLNANNAMSSNTIHSNIEELYSDIMFSPSASPEWEKSEATTMRNRTSFANERFVDMLSDMEDACISCLQSKSELLSTRMAEKVYSILSRVVTR